MIRKFLRSLLPEQIKVIDLYHDNDFDPVQIIADGYSGVIFKGGQGEWADVPRYKPSWWRIAAEHGLHRGWYWLCDSRHPAPDHIDEMKAWHIFEDVGELGIWIDMEKPVIHMTETDYWRTKYAGYRNVVDLAYLIHVEGCVPGIYTGPGAYELIMRGAPQTAHDYLATHDLWTAQYPYVYIPGISKPKLYGAWNNWIWWQYREGPDINLFNGTFESFELKYGEVIEPPPSPPDTGDEIMPVPDVPTVVGKARVATNIKTVDGVPPGAVASLPVDGLFYGDWNSGKTDIMHGRNREGDKNGFYRPTGEFVPWSEPIKVNAATLTVIAYSPTTPPDPTEPPVVNDLEVTASIVDGMPTVVIIGADGVADVTVDNVKYVKAT